MSQNLSSAAVVIDALRVNKRLSYLQARSTIPPGLWIRLQWRSQNADEIAFIKGRLLETSVIIFNRAPFRNMGTSLKGKNLLPKEANSFL